MESIRTPFPRDIWTECQTSAKPGDVWSFGITVRVIVDILIHFTIAENGSLIGVVEPMNYQESRR